MVVHASPDILEAVLHDGQHVFGCLLLRRVRRESGAELLDRLAAEAGQPRVQHQRHQRDERLTVRPARDETGLAL